MLHQKKEQIVNYVPIKTINNTNLGPVHDGNLLYTNGTGGRDF